MPDPSERPASSACTHGPLIQAASKLADALDDTSAVDWEDDRDLDKAHEALRKALYDASPSMVVGKMTVVVGTDPNNSVGAPCPTLDVTFENGTVIRLRANVGGGTLGHAMIHVYNAKDLGKDAGGVDASLGKLFATYRVTPQ